MANAPYPQKGPTPYTDDATPKVEASDDLRQTKDPQSAVPLSASPGDFEKCYNLSHRALGPDHDLVKQAHKLWMDAIRVKQEAD